MSSRLNNPAFLKLRLPLNNHIDDISGNKRESSSANIAYDENAFGKSYALFPGSSNYVRVPNNSELMQNKFTISFVGKLNPTGAFQHIVGVQTAAGNQRSWALFVGSNNSLSLQYWPTGSGAVGTPLYITTEDIAPYLLSDHHYTITGDAAAGEISLYIDGNIFRTQNRVGWSFFQSTAPFSVGARDVDGTPASRLTGNVGDIRYYSVILTASEIKTLYLLDKTANIQPNTQYPIKTFPELNDPTLFGAWLNKASKGNFLKDASYNNNDLVVDTAGEYTISSDTFISSSAIAYDSPSIPFSTKPVTITGWITKDNQSVYTTIFRLDLSYLISWDVNEIQLNNAGVSESTGVYHYDGQTLFYCIVYDVFSNVIKLYINGVLIKTGIPQASSDRDLRIGQVASGCETRYRDIRVYTEAKSDKWIADEYRKAVPDSSLKFWFKGDYSDYSNNYGENSLIQAGDGNVQVGNSKAIFDGSSCLKTNVNDLRINYADKTTTIMGWYRTPQVLSGQHRIISHDGSDDGWSIYVDTSRRLSIFPKNGVGNVFLLRDIQGRDNRWIHAAWLLTTDTIAASGNSARLFINGKEVATEYTVATTTIAYRDPEVGRYDVLIGARNILSPSEFAPDGMEIGEWKIYERALTPEEIDLHYKQTRKFY